MSSFISLLFLSFLRFHSATRGEDYQGLYLGKLNTYFHQVTGDVYCIDDHTFLIKNFFYDGLGKGENSFF